MVSKHKTNPWLNTQVCIKLNKCSNGEGIRHLGGPRIECKNIYSVRHPGGNI